MSIYSMTAYASVQESDATPGLDVPPHHGPRLGLEIRCVNSRFLDLTFRLPDELRAAEAGLREALGRRLKRGKVEVRLQIDESAASPLHAPSTSDLQQLLHAQDGVLAWLPQARPLSVAEALQLGRRSAPVLNQGPARTLALLETALQALLAARAREGVRLAQALRQRVRQLHALVNQAQPLVPQLVEQQRQRFLQRWAEAIGLNGDALPDATHERALAEATAYAVRIDVAEELTRLDAHLNEISRLLDQGGELGKRLDFLIQELHREANTLGSKSASLELTRISVDMKVLIEQLREQVQNLE